jgi:phosphoadenosine phosphosulfate reductase
MTTILPLEGLASSSKQSFSPDALEAVSNALESATAREIVAWAHGAVGDSMVVSTSFSDAVLVHLVHQVVPSARVVFIDTGFHFPETLAYARRVSDALGLDLVVLSAGLSPEESPCGSADCCQRRKVAPLKEALSGARAWVTGIRREETPERARSPIVSFDERYGVLKVNPLANWTFDDVCDYVSEHDLPVHPLTYQGYLSIGCAPVTSPARDPDDPRSGRWPGSDKSECGLHL